MGQGQDGEEEKKGGEEKKGALESADEKKKREEEERFEREFADDLAAKPKKEKNKGEGKAEALEPLEVPDQELFDLMQHKRRGLLLFLEKASQDQLDNVLQSALFRRQPVDSFVLQWPKVQRRVIATVCRVDGRRRPSQRQLQ